MQKFCLLLGLEGSFVYQVFIVTEQSNKRLPFFVQNKLLNECNTLMTSYGIVSVLKCTGITSLPTEQVLLVGLIKLFHATSIKTNFKNFFFDLSLLWLKYTYLANCSLRKDMNQAHCRLCHFLHDDPGTRVISNLGQQCKKESTHNMFYWILIHILFVVFCTIWG